MSATLRDVARVAGVSFKTVSNVINHGAIRLAVHELSLAAVAELADKVAAPRHVRVDVAPLDRAARGAPSHDASHA